MKIQFEIETESVISLLRFYISIEIYLKFSYLVSI